MGDVTTYREGTSTYEIVGLHTRAEDLRDRAHTAAELTGDLVDAATAALREWRGPHADTFRERLVTIFGLMGELKWRLLGTARMLEDFPSAPYRHPYEGYGLQVDTTIPRAAGGGSSAVPDELRAAAGALRSGVGAILGLGRAFHLQGVTATVTRPVPLTPIQRRNLLDQGFPEWEVDQMTRPLTEPVDPAALIRMPDDAGLADRIVATRRELADFTRAVGDAFDRADHGTLALLAEHPELAGYLVHGQGQMNGEAATAVLLAAFSLFDTAAKGGDPDGVVSREDLEAVASDPSMPDHLRAAAQHLLDNEDLFANIDTIDVPGQHITDGDGKISLEGLQLFIEMRDHLEVIALDFDTVDVAADDGGSPDGFVSFEDLQAVAGDRSLPAELRAAARWLIDHPDQLGKLGNYAKEAEDRQWYGYDSSAGYGTQEWTTFRFEDLVARVIDDQGFSSDPAAAAEFVLTLPVVDIGDVGFPIQLVGDDGVRSLANAALTHAAGSLVDQQAIIAHLPESTGAVRNQLITAFYDQMAQEMDALLAGPLAGMPHAEGHPGANWMLAAPWASEGVRAAIANEIRVFGIIGMPSSASQAAADGNQWIFSDIGARYAAFLELYRGTAPPGPNALEAFFRTSFDDGDAHIRTGFAAYVAALEEPDPVRRQELLFQGNALIALHEQAGVQPWLERVSVGPDRIAVRYIDLQFGDRTIHVDQDLPFHATTNNHVEAADLLDLDIDGLDPSDFAVPGRYEYVGEHSHPGAEGAIVLPEIAGVESWAEDFPTSITEWWEDGSGGRDPDGLDGTGATTWTNPAERMWMILKLFEQTHTDPAMWDTHDISAGFDDGRFDWLDPATGLR